MLRCASPGRRSGGVASMKGRSARFPGAEGWRCGAGDVGWVLGRWLSAEERFRDGRFCCAMRKMERKTVGFCVVPE